MSKRRLAGVGIMRKIFDIGMLIGWSIIGIICLVTEHKPTKMEYACIWVCYLTELGIKVFTNRYDDNDNNQNNHNFRNNNKMLSSLHCDRTAGKIVRHNQTPPAKA